VGASTDKSVRPNFGMPEPNGVFYLEKRLKFREILDGTSHTAVFSEHGIGDYSNAISSSTDMFWPQTNPANADEAFRQCESIDTKNLMYQRVSDVGAPWLQGYHSTTAYMHASPLACHPSSSRLLVALVPTVVAP
jgi:hypothetical protein